MPESPCPWQCPRHSPGGSRNPLGPMWTTKFMVKISRILGDWMT
jgi:hypothetical protein